MLAPGTPSAASDSYTRQERSKEQTAQPSIIIIIININNNNDEGDGDGIVAL
jgi:hypothetical protein